MAGRMRGGALDWRPVACAQLDHVMVIMVQMHELFQDECSHCFRWAWPGT